MLAKETGWSIATILWETPLAVLIQMQHAMFRFNGRWTVALGPSPTDVAVKAQVATLRTFFDREPEE